MYMMDPNNQVPIIFNQDIVNNSPDANNDFDFLSELFESPPEKNELKQNEDYQKVIDDLMNNTFVSNNDTIQKNEDSGKEHSSLIADLSKANEKLKQANKRLKKKIIAQQK
ncbi:hypothetical protein HNY73_004611 [Argiope bruennichi]|uniref:Uncharacterized protein n=1 Tax=Argiope bruennichi TaxID=94029 RepID=A0A8T0FPH7_ARGBR|nr:hypothetical protein HNY73_004611 [Argiope bruennichi]